MKTNEPIDQKAVVKEFRTTGRKLVEPIDAWVRKKPTKRGAVLFFYDEDAAEWWLHPIEYQTGKKPRYRLNCNIFAALVNNDKMYATTENLLRNAKRQRRKDAKRQAMLQDNQ